MEETVHGLDLKIKDKDLKIKNLQEKVKELESQLLVERKLARQHVDTKIAEQHLKQQQQDEQSTVPLRPPLANRLPVSNNKNFNENASTTIIKDQGNPTRALMENNISYNKTSILLPPTDGLVKYINPMEKENNPDMIEQSRLPKRAGRASICTTSRQIPLTSAPRRNSLIPLPSAPTSAQLTPALLPMPPCEVDEKEEIDECFPEQLIHCNSPKDVKTGGKKLMSSILRRSLRKKMLMKSPMQHHFRRGAVNVGMEKVRVSIGSRGRMAHRVLLGGGRRAGTKEIQQKQNQKEKERGWNIGTVGRTI